MNLTTKFSIGDVVWPVWSGRKEIKTPCPFCDGDGRILGANRESSHCPSCFGRKTTSTWEPEAWHVKQRLTIGEVRTLTSRFSDRDEETYMAEETGIGSGSVHSAANLFATREEAEAACIERNAAQAVGS